MTTSRNVSSAGISELFAGATLQAEEAMTYSDCSSEIVMSTRSYMALVLLGVWSAVPGSGGEPSPAVAEPEASISFVHLSGIRSWCVETRLRDVDAHCRCSLRRRRFFHWMPPSSLCGLNENLSTVALEMPVEEGGASITLDSDCACVSHVARLTSRGPR